MSILSSFQTLIRTNITLLQYLWSSSWEFPHKKASDANEMTSFGKRGVCVLVCVWVLVNYHTYHCVILFWTRFMSVKKIVKPVFCCFHSFVTFVCVFFWAMFYLLCILVLWESTRQTQNSEGMIIWYFNMYIVFCWKPLYYTMIKCKLIADERIECFCLQIVRQ